MADDLNEKALEAATAAFIAERDATMTCPRCGGVGHHHGFGEDGTDPDWCSICGGGGAVAAHEKDSEHVAAAIRAYKAAEPAPSVPAGYVAVLTKWLASYAYLLTSVEAFAAGNGAETFVLECAGAVRQIDGLLSAAPSPGDRT